MDAAVLILILRGGAASKKRRQGQKMCWRFFAVSEQLRAGISGWRAAGAAGKRKGNKGSGWKQSFRIRRILRKQSCGEWVNGECKGGEEGARIREREPGGKRDSGGYAFVSREHEDSKKGENHV